MSFSVGDFITVLQLANQTRQRFVDAPEQFKAISEDVKTLSNILRDVDDIQSQRDLTGQQKKSLDEIAQECHSVLEELNKTLDKYQELDSSAKGISGKSRKVWKRLQWDQKNIDQFRSRITLNISAFGTFLGQITTNISFAVRADVNRLHERQDDRERYEEHKAILDWLTPIDYAPQQSDFIARRQKGTGQWLIESEKFQEWLNKGGQTLFCTGIPGVGKTMISAIVVDHLCSRFQNDASVGIAYLYCNFRRQQEETSEALLLSLLKQLIQDRPSLSESVKNLYEYYRPKRTRPSLDEISKALHSVITGYSRAFIIIDALDECRVSDGGRKQLLSEISNLQSRTGINLFATSRLIPDIMKEFEGRSISLEIRASPEDLRRYLGGHMSSLPSFVLRSPSLQEEVQADIVKAVEGIFLLAQLHLNSLIGTRSLKALRAALKTLPKGPEGYDNAYKEAMERIEGQIKNSRELAKQVLSWITCAKRPLTTSELRHALAVEIGEFKLDEENLPEIEDVLSVCAGLVTVDEQSDVIRLVHYTTQEYFERTWTFWFPNAQKDIATVCVTYLSFDAFTGFCLSDADFEIRLQSNPLYSYAAKNWGHHVYAASTEVEQLVLTLLKSEPKVSASSQAMMVAGEYRYRRYSQQVPRQITGVHLAACFGLTEMTTTLLKNGFDQDPKDSYGRTPLSWAAASGHEAVVRLLVDRDDVEADSKDKYGRTPLWWAAGSGHEAVVRLLVDRDDVEADSKDIEGRTPLSRAAANGHEAVVRLLVDRDDVEANSKDEEGRTPLWWAAANGHEAVVKLLQSSERLSS